MQTCNLPYIITPMYVYIQLPIHSPLHLPVCPSIHSSVYPSTRPSIHLFIFPSIEPFLTRSFLFHHFVLSNLGRGVQDGFDVCDEPASGLARTPGISDERFERRFEQGQDMTNISRMRLHSSFDCHVTASLIFRLSRDSLTRRSTVT